VVAERREINCEEWRYKKVVDEESADDKENGVADERGPELWGEVGL
jgi:hypothetical protein